jgi:hypothetical protein
MKFLRNKKNIIFSVLGLLLIYFSLQYYSEMAPGKDLFIEEKKFKVELAESKEEREKGLSGKSGLCRKCGMLFEFSQPGRYGFWMKGMEFSLDFAWIYDGEIVHIDENIPQDLPGTIFPPVVIDRVLEVSAGTLSREGIKIGDKIRY